MIRRSVAAAAVLALFPVPGPAQAAAVVCPLTVASHAAGPPGAPENTVAGIRHAATTATVVEMDVRWSVTGYPVLMHDDTVDRTTPGTGRVADMGLSDLTKLPAQDYAPFKADPDFAAVKVPYAYDFLAAVNSTGVTALLDVKVVPDEFDAGKLMEYVGRFPGLRDRIVYMGTEASIRAMRGWYPDLSFVMIEYPPGGMIRTGESLRGMGAGGYAVPWDRITTAAVAYWHSYNLDVLTWTSDRAEYDQSTNWAKVRTAGADTLITNRAADARTWCG